MSLGHGHDELSQLPAPDQRGLGQWDCWDIGGRTPREIAAFNAGVRAVLSHSFEAALAIEAMPGFRVTRAGFAVAALQELAAAGEDLLILPVGFQKDDARGC